MSGVSCGIAIQNLHGERLSGEFHYIAYGFAIDDVGQAAAVLSHPARSRYYYGTTITSSAARNPHCIVPSQSNDTVVDGEPIPAGTIPRGPSRHALIIHPFHHTCIPLPSCGHCYQGTTTCVACQRVGPLGHRCHGRRMVVVMGSCAWLDPYNMRWGHWGLVFR